ncbi:hypothetical protein [Fulvivirga lutea]|nr:hypothetical protein [Fulvivirga lutea]
MRKSIVAILLMGFIFSACGFYSCPTYAKKEEPKKEIQQSQDERI